MYKNKISKPKLINRYGACLYVFLLFTIPT